MTLEARPPFRADAVGSLLRPRPLADARRQRATGRISSAELRNVEDQCIAAAIRKQEDVGLQAVTDGEMRRAYWHFDFLGQLGGVDLRQEGEPIVFQGKQTKPYTLKVVDKLDYVRPIMVDDFKFVRANAKVMAKQTIPSPSVLHFRGGRRAIDAAVYPDLDAFFSDLGAAYNKAMMAFYDAGCRYLQLDETNIAYLCDPDQLQALRDRGEDAGNLLNVYAEVINAAIKDRPDDLTISLHLCRGNFRSTWISKGGYGPVAEVLFNKIDVDAYFMEYDSDRSGGFEPLRFLPKGEKTVVLGLVTTKTGELESKDTIKRRVEEAATYAPLEQLALSPQCGFASTEEGNDLSEQQQWNKLRACVDIAREVWGSAGAAGLREVA
jgi:5-methyltetrahydropteroyltriglutamate--homocysteine methyltransferase